MTKKEEKQYSSRAWIEVDLAQYKNISHTKNAERKSIDKKEES